MAEIKESAVAKLLKARVEKNKNYKTTHDVERVHHLIASAHYMRDYLQTSSLVQSFMRELAGMSAKQAEIDAKEKEESDKELAEAQAADAPKPEPAPEAKTATQADWRGR